MKWILNLSMFLMLISCQMNNNKEVRDVEPGVSEKLAQYRARTYLNVKYRLAFDIPQNKEKPVTGLIHILWGQGGKQPLVVDFQGDSTQIYSVLLNEKAVDYQVKDEHIVISQLDTWAGENKLSIAFKASDQSLNRRDEFLYTLLVPDRARTLFPCFDQPDIKANYKLVLSVPETWNAVANGQIEKVDSLSHPGKHLVYFQETEPLPTYLFSFVAGKLQRELFNRGERSISIYHRETDPDKKAQCPEIARQVFDALEWVEDFTHIPYPFAKYDLIIIPGFQFGGMEHTGATLYNARSMFLNKQPTLGEKLRRSSLIAHETSHMWFGDYVTMRWFNDVWTKEVFANYFAAKIVEPQYPTVNHQLNFMRDYVPSAYVEDRTSGTVPVQQKLDNLKDAGLVYCNIIYDKSPVVMDMIVQQMGFESFRKGIQDYLQTHAYGNATWDELIASLSKFTDRNLKQMSEVWIKEKGMPVLQARVENGKLIVEESDPWNRGLVWPQRLKYKLMEGDVAEDVIVEIGDSLSVATVDLKQQFQNPVILPNIDGRGYGFFRMNAADVKGVFACMETTTDELLKGSLLISLNENMQNHALNVDEYMHSMIQYLSAEESDLLYSMALGYLNSAIRFADSDYTWLEKDLWNLVEQGRKPQFSLQAFRSYLSMADSDEAVKRLYQIWKDEENPSGCTLSENDYISLSYQLAVHLPDKADEIVKEQLSRISNQDRQEEYKFISPAVSPQKSVRDSVFHSLLEAKNRRIEPWASSALSLLNHRLRDKESVPYIGKGLLELKEVQQTGDIFFPTAWLRALLGGHTSEEALQEVENFWKSHKDYPDKLSSKIRQQSDHLYRLNLKN